MKIKVAIIDDEPLARKRIKRLLANEPDFEIVGECSDGLAAIAAIETEKPDLIFLDVQMPEVNGFDVLENINSENVPAIVFVTAYDQYTLRAFDVHAVDYLLKPFAEERFHQTLARAKARLKTKSQSETNQELINLLALLKPPQKYLERLIVNHKNRLLIVPIAEVNWIETYGNYLKIHHQDATYLLRETMNNLAAQLDAGKFLRIHRSSLVNIERIKELQPMFGGQYAVILRDGTELTLSRNYRKEILNSFEI